MNGVIFLSAALKLFWAFVALFILWWAVRLIRKSTGRNMRAVLDRVDTNPIAAAIYYSATWIGVCLVIGMAVG